MARTAEEIALALKESIESSDATLDAEQGPIPDVMIRPQSGELSRSSQEAEDLRRLFTIQFPDSITEEETRDALGNYGSSPGEGERARVLQYFMRFTRPVADIEIAVGNLVGNSDSTLSYRVVNSVTMSAAAADSYYNPTRGAYEIATLVEATGVGPQYELPKQRINRLLTPIVGIDVTENRVKAKNGLGAESTNSQANRLRTALLGINQGAPGGIKKRITDAFPVVISDVAVVQPFEAEWSRIVSGPAVDIYMIGETTETDTQTVNTVAGQTSIALRYKPATKVNSVLVNGVTSPIAYTLIQDVSKESGLSLAANDSVFFETPFLFGDVVVIEYEYNKALDNVYNSVYSEGQEYLFNTNFLIRSPFPVYPVIKGEVRTLPSYSPDDIESQVLSYLESYFNFTKFTSIILPEMVRQQMLSEIAGIQSFRLTAFHRSEGSRGDVEPLEYSKSEYSQYDETLVGIKFIR